MRWTDKTQAHTLFSWQCQHVRCIYYYILGEEAKGEWFSCSNSDLWVSPFENCIISILIFFFKWVKCNLKRISWNTIITTSMKEPLSLIFKPLNETKVTRLPSLFSISKELSSCAWGLQWLFRQGQTWMIRKNGNWFIS